MEDLYNTFTIIIENEMAKVLAHPEKLLNTL